MMTLSIKNSLVKKIHQNSIFIFIVLTVLSVGLVLKFSGAPKLQFQILTGLSLIYLSWALFHHTLDKSLSLEIVIEYILTALLAVIILYGTLL